MDSKDVLDDHLSYKRINLNSKTVLNIEKRLLRSVLALIIILVGSFLGELFTVGYKGVFYIPYLLGLTIFCMPLIFIFTSRAFRRKLLRSSYINDRFRIGLPVSLIISYFGSLVIMFFSAVKALALFTMDRNVLLGACFTLLVLIGIYQLYACTYLMKTFIKFMQQQRLLNKTNT